MTQARPQKKELTTEQALRDLFTFADQATEAELPKYKDDFIKALADRPESVVRIKSYLLKVFMACLQKDPRSVDYQEVRSALIADLANPQHYAAAANRIEAELKQIVITCYSELDKLRLLTTFVPWSEKFTQLLGKFYLDACQVCLRDGWNNNLAVRYYEQAMIFDSGLTLSNELHTELGLVYAKLKQYDRACHHFGYDDKPLDNWQARLLRADAYAAMADYQASIKSLNPLRDFEHNYDVMATRGYTNLQLANYEKAIQNFDAAIKIKPTYQYSQRISLYGIYRGRGLANRFIGNFAAAERDCQIALLEAQKARESGMDSVSCDTFIVYSHLDLAKIKLEQTKQRTYTGYADKDFLQATQVKDAHLALRLYAQLQLAQHVKNQEEKHSTNYSAEIQELKEALANLYRQTQHQLLQHVQATCLCLLTLAELHAGNFDAAKNYYLQIFLLGAVNHLPISFQQDFFEMPLFLTREEAENSTTSRPLQELQMAKNLEKDRKHRPLSQAALWRMLGTTASLPLLFNKLDSSLDHVSATLGMICNELRLRVIQNHEPIAPIATVVLKQNAVLLRYVQAHHPVLFAEVAKHDEIPSKKTKKYPIGKLFEFYQQCDAMKQPPIYSLTDTTEGNRFISNRNL